MKSRPAPSRPPLAATVAVTSGDIPADAASGDRAVDIANRLRPVLLRLSRELRRETHALGVTGSQVHILVTIRDTPGVGVVDLAVREQMTAPSISAHIDRLERAGLVVRARRGDVADRRRVGLTITADGRRVLAAVRNRRTAWLARRIRALGDDDVARIDAAVAPLLRVLEQPWSAR